MNELEKKKVRAQALMEAFEILHRYYMTAADVKVMEIIEKAQKDILAAL